TRFHEELVCLLRSRLRIVVLIVLVPTLFFFIKRLIESDDTNVSFSPRSVLIPHAIVAAVYIGLALLLWSNRTLCLPSLRTIELVLFGMLAGLFALQQALEFTSPLFTSAARAHRDIPLDRILTIGLSIRWFFLIVLYGVFVPN